MTSRWHDVLSLIRTGLSNRSSGNLEAGRKSFEEALSLAKDIDESHYLTVAAKHNLESLNRYEKAFRESPDLISEMKADLATAVKLEATGDYSAASTYRKKATDISELLLGESDVFTIWQYQKLGDFYKNMLSPRLATKAYGEAFSNLKKIYGRCGLPEIYWQIAADYFMMQFSSETPQYSHLHTRNVSKAKSILLFLQESESHDTTLSDDSKHVLSRLLLDYVIETGDFIEPIDDLLERCEKGSVDPAIVKPMDLQLFHLYLLLGKYAAAERLAAKLINNRDLQGQQAGYLDILIAVYAYRVKGDFRQCELALMHIAAHIRYGTFKQYYWLMQFAEFRLRSSSLDETKFLLEAANPYFSSEKELGYVQTHDDPFAARIWPEYYRCAGHPERAIALLKAAEENPNIGQTLWERLDHKELLARAYFRIGEYNKAEQLFKEVIAIREKVLGEEHPLSGYTMSYLADLYNTMGEEKKAIETAMKAKHILEKHLPEDHIRRMQLLAVIADIHRNTGNQEEALHTDMKLQQLQQQRIATGLNHHKLQIPEWLAKLHNNTIQQRQNLPLLSNGRRP